MDFYYYSAIEGAYITFIQVLQLETDLVIFVSSPAFVLVSPSVGPSVCPFNNISYKPLAKITPNLYEIGTVRDKDELYTFLRSKSQRRRHCLEL